MLYKRCLSFLVVAFGTVQVTAHAAISPALGLTGTPVRNDVQRPSANKPCGNQALSAIDTSKAVVADASGQFQVSITNFNGGTDGSRQVSLKVDASGTGKTLVAGTVSKNGQKSPTGTGTEQITAALPAGVKCAGGATKDLCLASFTTASGFGNCVVVKQGGGAGNNTASTTTSSGGTSTTTGGKKTPTNKPKTTKNPGGKKPREVLLVW